ncbi:MAG: 50S ribosomal protein L4 [Candidatus Pacebacteria bacterium]|nr:50S ribosomal protein L4 [Candidatus Paceibacterota bacterium]
MEKTKDKKIQTSVKTELSVYSQEGKEMGKMELPKRVFNMPWNADLVHQVVVSIESNARTPIAHTKGRGDVRGGGHKPWRQKGTGRARHGSRRSPIWVGGGVTHGPLSEKNYGKKINKKMKTQALYAVLSRKVKDKEIILLDTLNVSEPKTKNAKEILASLQKVKNFKGLSKKKNTAYIALLKKDDAVIKSFRNIGNISLGKLSDINPARLLNFKYLIITNPKESFTFLEGKSSTK